MAAVSTIRSRTKSAFRKCARSESAWRWRKACGTRSIKDNLVICRDSVISPVDGSAEKNKKPIDFYFSAYWCVPCRTITPHLASNSSEGMLSAPNRFNLSNSEVKAIDWTGGSMPFRRDALPRVQFPLPLRHANAIARNKFASKTIKCSCLDLAPRPTR